ncbi:MAG: FAD-binding oxidoreductase [Candidatus Poribacteria bacterium]|nr:FAD-binding oxidoreductase [Candidatus Poribacteria bacterium]
MADLKARFAAIVGTEQVERLDEGVAELGVDEPMTRVSPKTTDDLIEAVKFANTESIPLIPTGNGSAFHLGNLPVEGRVLLSTRNLHATVDYEPRDLTGIFQAGKRLADIQGELGKHDQFLALDPPNRASATIGGIVSTNVSGPLRAAYGTPRDLCLGLKAVMIDGTFVKGGGRVVKNVAGYDMTRMFLGSLGTLGVIVEAAFRLHPIPTDRRCVIASMKSWEAAQSLAAQVVHSELQPLFVELVGETEPTVLVGFGGIAEQVAYQVERVESLAKDAARVEIASGDDFDARHAALLDALDAAHRDDTRLVLRIGTAMTQVLPAREILMRLVDERHFGVQSTIHYPSGAQYAIVKMDEGASGESTVELVERLRKEVHALNGRVVVESAPVEAKRRMDVWGEPTGPLAVMEQLKRRLDPNALLNRGRYLRGIP